MKTIKTEKYIITTTFPGEKAETSDYTNYGWSIASINNPDDKNWLRMGEVSRNFANALLQGDEEIIDQELAYYIRTFEKDVSKVKGILGTLSFHALLWQFDGNRYYIKSRNKETFADFKKRVYKDFPDYNVEFYEDKPRH